MNRTKINSHIRWVKHLFTKSGVISLGFEHFLAMIPATILVPILVNNTVGADIIDISLVLFTSGVGTIAFTIASRGKIPAYLGSSFAYIGLTIYLIESQISTGINPQLAYHYVGWSYIFSGILLVALSFLYKIANIDRFLSFILPASVVGPAISLIGLELADTAVVDSGFDISAGVVDKNAAIVSIITLLVIILFSLVKHRILKNAAIFVGMFVGYTIYYFINGFSGINLSPEEIFRFSMPNFQIPFLYFPKNWLSLLISVIPATFIIFTENIGRVTVINQMVNQNKEEKGIFNKNSIKQLHSGLLSHGIASIIATLIGSVPNTIYAENIAVMGIHDSKPKKDPNPKIEQMSKPYSIYPLMVAAVLAMIFSFVGAIQSFLIQTPKAIIGGMELFLFGIISAPGIQLLVDQRVNYKKISNQIITASVLISGVSGLSVNLGIVELKGMSLGFVVGILLNLLVQFLKWIGNTCDVVSFDELLEECLSAMIGKEANAEFDDRKIDLSTGEQEIRLMDASDLFLAFRGYATKVWTSGTTESADWAIDAVKHATCAKILDGNDVLFTIRKTANGLTVDFDISKIDQETIHIYNNDYKDAIDYDYEIFKIDITKNIPIRKIKELISNVTQKSVVKSESIQNNCHKNINY